MGFFSKKDQNGSDGSESDAQSAQPASPSPSPTRPESPETAAATDASGNDSDKKELSQEDARRHAIAGKQLAAAFGEMVTLLLRSKADRSRPLSDLEWMIAPAVMTGQFAIADAQSKTTGAISPVGAVLWAMVSEEVDGKLSDVTKTDLRLEAQEWKSGDIPWIILAMGDKRVVAGLIKKISDEVFKSQAPKIRSRDKDGKPVVGRVQAGEPPAGTDASEPSGNA